MQVIEKVKVVPEGYNGAGMDGMYGRRDVNGKANAGLTLGIIGTALISNGNITISIPFINKGIMFNQSDLETFRQLLTK